MAGLLDGVNQRTRLAGHNRLELLLFRLTGRQRFGINVFKVQEVIRCPALTKIPNAHRVVRGIANMRGKTITVIDLSLAIGRPALDTNSSNCYVIITEYNRSTQGFLVGAVDHIVNMNWEAILAPPKATGNNSYMTAVTRIDDELVEIIDVEKVLAEVQQPHMDVAESVLATQHDRTTVHHVLVVDDSSVARNQIKRCLDQIGVTATLANNGREGVDLLKKWAAEGPIEERVALVISDVEMPEMDGYTLTREVRDDPALKGLYVVLHTSLSGVFNSALIEKVGADKFIAKFKPDELASAVIERLNLTVAA